MEKNDLLLRILVEKGLLTAERVDELKKRGDDLKPNLSSIIINLNYVDEEELTKVKAEISGLAYYNIQSDEVPENALNFLSEDISRTYKIVCFSRDNKTVNIGLVEPDLKAMEAVNFLASEGHLHPVFYLI